MTTDDEIQRAERCVSCDGIVASWGRDEPYCTNGCKSPYGPVPSDMVLVGHCKDCRWQEENYSGLTRTRRPVCTSPESASIDAPDTYGCRYWERRTP